MEDMVFITSSDRTGKSNSAMLKHLATAVALADREDREAEERASEDAEDVIVVGAGSVGSDLLTDGYVEITDLPVESDTSRQSFKNIHGKKSRW